MPTLPRLRQSSFHWLRGIALSLLVLSAASCSKRAVRTPPPPASSAPLAQADVAAYSSRVEKELRGDILPYWLAHAPDPKGGFYGEVSCKGNPDADAPRGALLTARILWAFSAAYRHYKDPAYLEMAQRAYGDLNARFLDKENGGFYWMVDADGTPLDTRKILYGQAFAVYALSEYNRATGDKAALGEAVVLYRLLEKHCRDNVNGGYLEEFSSDWTVQRNRSMGRHGSAMGATGQKSQNTHIHMLEAYTNLLRAWPDAGLRQNLAALQDVLLTKMLTPTHHLRLFMAEDWTQNGDEISYGHDIEFSWLLVESSEVLGDPERLARTRAIAVDIVRATDADGVDADGGILNEGLPDGTLTDSGKDWWPQAESTIGFLNAWQITGDPRYLRDSQRSWNFIDAHIVDHKYGEWFRAVNKDGSLPGHQEKIGFWKCPYHNSRACLEILDRLDAGPVIK
jgi:cellobiose epimerase